MTAKSSPLSTNDLREKLEAIVVQGITADGQRLKADMCTQFNDYREFLRELVTNAYDAGAKLVRVTVTETSGEFSVAVADDGSGMSREAVMDYMALYRSRKPGDPKAAIGRHGVGKLSIAAAPNQSRFQMTTSTGRQAWSLNTGSLLADAPITIRAVHPVPEHGSRFTVTYAAQNDLAREIKGFQEVLIRYLSFLPLSIQLHWQIDEQQQRWKLPSRAWSMPTVVAGQTVRLKVGGKVYEVVVDIANACHEVYQNRVFITDKYNLLEKDKPLLPHLHLRVDGPFELPFGRHCIRNEADVLPNLAVQLWKVLPELVCDLYHAYMGGCLANLGLDERTFEELACDLLEPSKRQMFPFLRKLPIFLGVTGSRFALADLEEAKRQYGVLYLDDGTLAGADYSVFEAPVLSRRQIGSALRLLEQEYRDYLVRLDVADTILEAPLKDAPLGVREKRFQNHLQIRRTNDFQENETVVAHQRTMPGTRGVGLEKLVLVDDTVRTASLELTDVLFRVGYLVQRDGKTPCRTQRFLWQEKRKTVVVNLHHPETERLLAASETDPVLAGHWAIAMCLADTGRGLLPHLSAAARDHLLLLDALAKLDESAADVQVESPVTSQGPKFDRYLRDLRDLLR